MNKILICILASVVLQSAGLAEPTKKAQPQDRTKLIWDSVHEQLSVQIDVWFEKGEFPKIIQLLRVQNQFEPADYEIATNLGWMLENVEQWDEALSVYVRFRKQNPNDPDSAYPEAHFYFGKKAYAKIPALLEPTIPKNPQPNAYRTLAHSYDRMKLFADSKRIWESYLKRFPDDGAAKANLAKVANKLRTPQK